ncbi:MAG TPA: RICIN domain-containing protein [Polyangiaceae bacterium]
MCSHNASVLSLRLGALALLTACNTTPLDVVYAVDSAAVADAGPDAANPPDAAPDAAAGGAGGAGGAGAGGAPADAGPCSMAGPGRYVLRSRANGLCLGQGAPTSVFGNPGFLLDFAADCRLEARSWQLVATATPNVFTLQNQSPPRFVLDVQMAGTRDGTPVITYGVTGFDNQRFKVRARDTFASELRPQHRPQSCVSASANSAEIAACDPTDSTQAWLLQRSDCL